MTTRMDFLINANDRASRVFSKVARAATKLDFVVKGMKMANVAAMRTSLVALGAQATPVILALGAALAKVGPAALIAVPALAALVASMTAVKLAMFGVKDAFAAAASGDMKEFAEALKKLSPAAQRFVKDGVKLIPALRSMRKAVQEAFFSKIPAGTLDRIAKNLLPALRSGLTAVSSSLGRASANLATFLKTGEARTGLTKTFAGIIGALKPLERVPATLARAFAGLAASAAPFLTKLTSGFARMLDGLSSKISKASASGGLTAMIQSALDTLNQLGRIAGNVGRIIGGLFKGSANSSLVDSIERITKAIADAVNSERGQQIIAKVFEIISKAGPVITIAAGLTWAITGIVGALAAIATPAGAVAGVVLALAGGFAFLYSKSAALREIVAGVGGKLRELWDLFVAKGLPIVKDFAQKALGAAIKGFEDIRAAIQRNRPQLEQLWMMFKKVAEFVISTWPSMAAVAIGALKLVFGGITRTIEIIGAAVRQFDLFGAATIAAFRVILHGAVEGFGWIPGLGGKLREAQGKFEAFAGKVSYAVKTIPDTIALKVSTPGSVNAQLELSKLKIGLAALTDKIIGLTTRGVPVTMADLNSVKAKAEALERTYAVAIRVDGGSAAAATLNAVKAAAERMERAYTVTTLHREVYAAQNKPQMRAAGGPVLAGQPYIVGEKRPELFIPNSSGRIAPRVPGMSGGGGVGRGGRMRLEVTAGGASDALINELVKVLRYRISIDGGGDVQTALGS